jgi:uncharacterized protein YukE
LGYKEGKGENEMADVTNLEIETGRLQRDIESLKNDLSGMRRTGDDMMNSIHELSAMWEGPAKEVFLVQFQSDYEMLQSMEEAIGGLIKGLEYAREQYDKCENDVSSAIYAIRV